MILTIALRAAAAAGGGVLYRMLLVPRLAAEPVVMIEPYEAASGNVVRMSPREYQDWIAQESLFSDAAARSVRRLGVDLGSWAEAPEPGMSLLVNGRGDTVPSATTVVETIRRTNPDVPIEESTIVGAPPPAVRAERLTRAWAIGVAALLIMIQTVVSLYGAAAYAAAGRRREYALKMAVGATRPKIAFAALRSTLVDTAAGLVIGTAVVAAAARHLKKLAGGAAATVPTPSVHAAALVGVAALATAAALRPAPRATRVNPATILTDDTGA